MKRIYLYTIFLLFFLACEEVTRWEQETEFTPRLVVEGFVTNVPDLNYVQLSLPVDDPAGLPAPVNHASVFVGDGENRVRLLQDPANPGRYVPENLFRAVVNKTYFLYIEVEDFSFTARSRMIPVGPQMDFNYSKISEDSTLFRINPANGSDPSMTRYIVEWREDGAFRSSVFYNFQLSSVDVNEFFKPASETLVFPGHARIIRQKYSLSPDHQKYIRGMLSETEWKGGWFDVMPGNLYTNMSQGGAGYFGAAAVVVDTVYFE
jgi:hypothetical protein